MPSQCIIPDLPEAPPLHPGTREPAGAEDLVNFERGE